MNETGWGGARLGAGRPKGSKNPKTIARHAAFRLLPYADNPLQWLLALMADTRQDLRYRLDAAIAAIPYVHYKKDSAGFATESIAN